MAASQSRCAMRDPYMSAVGYYGVPPTEAGRTFSSIFVEYLEYRHQAPLDDPQHRWGGLVFAVPRDA